MQRELPAVTPTENRLAVDRTQAVYDAHIALEDSLASADALAKAAKEQSQTIEGFNPDEMLQKCLDDVRRQCLICLRLFSPSRTLRTTRGMDTVSALYGSAAAPTERLNGFLKYIRTRLGDVIPCAVPVCAVRIAKRTSSQAASKMAFDELIKLLSFAADEAEDSGSITARAVRTLDTAPGLSRAAMDLALLKAECDAASDDRSHPLSSIRTQLSACLSPEAVSSVLAHEAACWQHVPALRRAAEEQTAKRLSASAPSPASAAPSPTATTPALANSSERTATVTSNPVATANQKTHSTEPAESTSVLSRLMSNKSGWQGHVVKAIAAVLMAVLVRLLLMRLYGVAKSAASLAHGAPARRRTLTL